MGTHRRNFLKTASMFAVGLGMPALGGRIAAAANRYDRTIAGGTSFDMYKRESFTPYLNSDFRVKVGLRSMNLRLVQITDLKQASKHPSRIRGKENFSLIFKPAGNEKTFGDNTYHLEHGSLGSFPMFLVGVGEQGSSRRYEATVVRL